MGTEQGTILPLFYRPYGYCHWSNVNLLKAVWSYIFNRSLFILWPRLTVGVNVLGLHLASGDRPSLKGLRDIRVGNSWTWRGLLARIQIPVKVFTTALFVTWITNYTKGPQLVVCSMRQKNLYKLLNTTEGTSVPSVLDRNLLLEK